MEHVTAVTSQPAFFAMAMLSSSLGSKHVFADITKSQERFFMHPYVKICVIFAFFFVYTRDIVLALVLGCFFVLTFRGIINEHKRFNIIQPQAHDGIKHTVQTYKDNIAKIKNRA